MMKGVTLEKTGGVENANRSNLKKGQKAHTMLEEGKVKGKLLLIHEQEN